MSRNLTVVLLAAGAAGAVTALFHLHLMEAFWAAAFTASIFTRREP